MNFQPIKYANDDDKYYQTPRGYGYNSGHSSRGYEDPQNLNPYNDGFHEQFRVENENLQKYLNEVDQKSSHECSLNVAAQWFFENNVNEATQLDAVSAPFFPQFTVAYRVTLTWIQGTCTGVVIGNDY